MSCLPGDFRKKQSARCSLVLFIEQRRLAAIENDMAVRFCDASDPDFKFISIQTEKLCCFDIDQLFQYVPPEFISAALSDDNAPRVPSLIECLLPRKLFICEKKLVRQALNPISGLGISSVLNITVSPPGHRPEITHNFPIEDSPSCDIAAGARASSRLIMKSCNCMSAVCVQTRLLLKEMLDKQGSVLVHCAAGVSRSGSVVIDFVMHALSLDFHAAKALVCKSRPEVNPNVAFEGQLDKSPRWGLAAMDMLGGIIAKLRYQAARAARDKGCDTE